MRTRNQSHSADSSDEDALVQVREGKCASHRSRNLEGGKYAFWKREPSGEITAANYEHRARNRVHINAGIDLNNLTRVVKHCKERGRKKSNSQR